MTNAKISKTAKAVLRNKSVSAAIAQALVKHSYAFSRNGFVVKVDGKEYRIKAASQTANTNTVLNNLK